MLHTWKPTEGEKRVCINLGSKYAVEVAYYPSRLGGYANATIKVTTVEQCDELLLALCEARRLLTDPGYLSVTEAEKVALRAWDAPNPLLNSPSAPVTPRPSQEPENGVSAVKNGGAK